MNLSTANSSFAGNITATSPDYISQSSLDFSSIAQNSNVTFDGNSTDINVTLSNVTAPASSHSNYGFFVTTFAVFSPGILAHILALYCLVTEVGKKMIFAKRLLLGLCVVDILGLIAIFFHHTIGVYFTNPPVPLCAVNSFLMGFLPLMSGALTTYMAVERCVKFHAPFWHAVNATSWKMRLPIVLTGLILATVALFPMLGLGFIVSQDDPKRCLTFPTTVPSMYNSPEGIFTIAYATVGLITVAVDVTCNTITISTLTSVKEKRLNISGAKEGKSAEMAMTRMLIWLSCVFLVTLTPLYVSLVMMYAGYNLSRAVKTLTHLLAGFNFTLDPFIYVFTMKTYRRKVVNLFTSCCRKEAGSAYEIKSASTKESDDNKDDN